MQSAGRERNPGTVNSPAKALSRSGLGCLQTAQQTPVWPRPTEREEPSNSGGRIVPEHSGLHVAPCQVLTSSSLTPWEVTEGFAEGVQDLSSVVSLYPAARG